MPIVIIAHMLTWHMVIAIMIMVLADYVHQISPSKSVMTIFIAGHFMGGYGYTKFALPGDKFAKATHYLLSAAQQNGKHDRTLKSR